MKSGSSAIAAKIKEALGKGIGTTSGTTGAEVSGAVEAFVPKDLQGVWYAASDSKWAEIRVTSGAGSKFEAVVAERDASGSSMVDAVGKFVAPNKVEYKEASVNGAEGGKGSFKGEVSDDHQRIDGTLSGILTLRTSIFNGSVPPASP